MALQFGFRATGVDSAPNKATTPTGIMNAVLAAYGAGSTELANAMTYGTLASFLCHYIIKYNEDNGTVNQPVEILPLIQQDEYMFSECIEGVSSYIYLLDILVGANILKTNVAQTEYYLSSFVLWGPSQQIYNITDLIDSCNVGACMKANWIPTNTNINPGCTCDVTPCGACPVFDNITLPHTFCA